MCTENRQTGKMYADRNILNCPHIETKLKQNSFKQFWNNFENGFQNTL